MKRVINTTHIKKDMGEVLKYFALFFCAILFWEMVLFTQTTGIRLASLTFLFFLPAEALFFAGLCGFGKKISRFLPIVVIMIINIFYIIQTIYLRNFGSFFSVSMAGMGNDAVGNFGWALKDTIIKSLGLLLIMIIPTVVVTVVGIIKKNIYLGYGLFIHIGVIVLSIILWVVASFGLKLLGTGRNSAYSLLTSSYAETQTTANKLGIMTTSLVEAGSYYLGLSFEEDKIDLLEDKKDDEILIKVEAIPTPGITDTESTIEEPEKEEIIATPHINENIKLKELYNSSSDEKFKSLTGYLEGREPSYTNEYTGLFEGYNLIYICAEGFWSYACNEDVTPTLYKMANNGIVLNNYYNSFYNTTTNGEFAFCTSLWPDVSRNASAGTDVGSFARSASVYMPQGLGDLFTSEGVNSYAFHNYYGKYYRRILSWPNLGYTCKFTGDGMRFTSNWPASDLELMEQSVDDYINDKQFHAYYMTFSGHGPYTNSNYMFNKNIGEVNFLNQNAELIEEAKGYLAGNLELDKAMEYLLNRLKEAGKLDNTVIVIAGDHYPYYLSKEARNSLVGYEMDEKFDIYHSTCIIYNAGLSEPIINDNYCCNVDIAPTILNLFNIPYDSRLMMGHDVFDNGIHRAALYNKSFISDMVKYNYEKDEAFWSDEAQALSENEKNVYLENMISLVEKEYQASCRIISENYYLQLYKAAGLISDEEYSEELLREENAKNLDEQYNEEDAVKAAEKEAQKAQEEEEQRAKEEEAAQLEIIRQLLENQQEGAEN